MPPAPAPIISTTILSWNRADLLERTVTSYLETITVPHELVIVDNASTDGADEVLRRLCSEHPDIRPIFLTASEGGEAINRGLEQSQGRFLHISENDIEYLAGWDTTVLDVFGSFPTLGQLSPLGPVPTDDEVWVIKPSGLRHAAGRIIYETVSDVSTTSVLRRELWDAGVRVSNLKGASADAGVGLPDCPALSQAVRQLGYMTAWADRNLIRAIGQATTEDHLYNRNKPLLGEDGMRERGARARPSRTSFLYGPETFSPEKSVPSESCPEPYLWSMRDGWTAEVETLELLYSLVRVIKPVLAVETGTWHGRAAESMGRALAENGRGRLVTLEIDPESHAVAANRIAQSGLSDIVNALNMASLDYTPDEPIDFLLLDSDLPIRGPEFERFRPHLRDGAIVVFHDTSAEHGVVLDSVRSFEARGALTAMHLRTPRGIAVCQYLADGGPVKTTVDSPRHIARWKRGR